MPKAMVERLMKTDMDVSLKTIEKLALRMGRSVNEPGFGKKAQYHFIRNVAFTWMSPFMSRRTYVHNIDALIPPPSDRGIVFACNHRTFFDSYLYLYCLYHKGANWPRKIYFPVRSDFFYDSPTGILVNFAAGGGCMYPPIYREKEKRALNNDAVDRLIALLDSPHSLVGLHPEGTRNKGNPYELLPAQPGIGQIVLKAKPMVIPVFVNGLNNDFLSSLRTSFQRNAKRTNPVIVSFGAPVDYDEFTKSKPRATLYKKCSDKIHVAIRECGQQEKRIREKIINGTIESSHPNWLWHAPTH